MVSCMLLEGVILDGNLSISAIKNMLQQKTPLLTIHLASKGRQSICAMITFLQRSLTTDISLTTGIKTTNIGLNF